MEHFVVLSYDCSLFRQEWPRPIPNCQCRLPIRQCHRARPTIHRTVQRDGLLANNNDTDAPTDRAAIPNPRGEAKLLDSDRGRPISHLSTYRKDGCGEPAIPAGWWKAAHGLSIATKCRFKEADLGLGYVECFAPLLAASRSRCSASVSSLSHPDNNVMARTMTPPALDRLRLQDMALPLCSEGTSIQLFAFKSGMARGYSRRAEKWRFCLRRQGRPAIIKCVTMQPSGQN